LFSTSPPETIDHQFIIKTVSKETKTRIILTKPLILGYYSSVKQEIPQITSFQKWMFSACN